MWSSLLRPGRRCRKFLPREQTRKHCRPQQIHRRFGALSNTLERLSLWPTCFWIWWSLVRHRLCRDFVQGLWSHNRDSLICSSKQKQGVSGLDIKESPSPFGNDTLPLRANFYGCSKLSGWRYVIFVHDNPSKLVSQV